MASYSKIVFANFATFVGMGFSKWNYDHYIKIRKSIYEKGKR